MSVLSYVRCAVLIGIGWGVIGLVYFGLAVALVFDEAVLKRLVDGLANHAEWLE